MGVALLKTEVFLLHFKKNLREQLKALLYACQAGSLQCADFDLR